jgi:hypothetical protein
MLDYTRLRYLLRDIYLKPTAVQSNLARSEADLVAMAASMGLITTQISSHEFGRDWRITNRGLLLLNEEN